MPKSGSLWVRLKGKLKRPVAKAAGDRRSEATAALQARAGDEPPESAVDQAEEHLRRKYRDIPK